MTKNEADDLGNSAVAARQIRQRLEALQRAGVEYIPARIVQEMENALRTARDDRRGAPQTASESPEVSAARPPVRSKPTQTHAPALVQEPVPLKKPARPSAKDFALSVDPAAAAAFFGAAGFDSPATPSADRPGVLHEIAEIVSVCVKCPILAATRTQTVFGGGSPTARLMFIGEAPGADEDRTGAPFVGRAGKLLTDMITKGMGLSREEVYITNILKCRPPGNRDPHPDECANCLPYLERQLEIIRPEFLCLLGRVAAHNVLQTNVPMGKLRGRWHSVRGIPALVTFHPSYLLRNPPAKKDAWDDLQLIMKEMRIPIPARKKE